MATYQKGVQDAVQSIRPPESNLQFDAQFLSTRQSAYDKSHAKLSKMYGTILNSPLTREDNIQSREEFFKLIDGDLKKIAGMDLSKDSNASEAANVFSQIYDNNHLVKDMVWTKNFNAEMRRAEEFKDCADPKDCGGSYWDEGVKYMQYKKEEFKNANSNESLSFQNVSFIPKQNIMDDAIERFKELDPEIKQVVPSADGRYRITMTNGSVAYKPMLDFFQQAFQNDPKFMDMYKVQSYNRRKDEIYQSMNSGDYDNLNEASVGWFEKRRGQVEESFNELTRDIDLENKDLKKKLENYEKDINNNAPLSNAEKEEYLALRDAYGASQILKAHTDQVKIAKKNLHYQSNRKLLEDNVDNQNALVMFNQEVGRVSKTLADLTYQEEYDEDAFALENMKFSHRLELQRRDHLNAEKIASMKNSFNPLNSKSSKLVKEINNKSSELNGLLKGSTKGVDPLAEYMSKDSDPNSPWNKLNFQQPETGKTIEDYIGKSGLMKSEVASAEENYYKDLFKKDQELNDLILQSIANEYEKSAKEGRKEAVLEFDEGRDLSETFRIVKYNPKYWEPQDNKFTSSIDESSVQNILGYYNTARDNNRESVNINNLLSNLLTHKDVDDRLKTIISQF